MMFSSSMVPLVVFLLLAVCMQLTGGSLSSDEKEEILRAHNYFRGRVDPIATNMLRMEWNDELSYIAQFWATNCYYEMNSRRDFQSSEYDYVGENLASTTNSSVNYTELVHSWFLLGKNYSYFKSACRSNSNTNGSDSELCASYTQLVWADSISLGCGSMRCENLRSRYATTQDSLFFVCNYGPGGSFLGVQPYKSGSRVCSSCPSQNSHCVNKLCSRYSSTSKPEAVPAISLLLQLIITTILSLAI